MGALIRKAVPADAPRWLDLLIAAFGEDYPDKQVYDLGWISNQFLSPTCIETWVAEVDGRLHGSVAFLPPFLENNNPVANLGRVLIRPEGHADGSAEALLKKVAETAAEKNRILLVSRVFASDNAQQILFENAGFVCVGFQPLKHLNRSREGTLFYLKLARPELVSRLPISESLPQISELAALVLASLKLPNPPLVRDGATGYPLQSDLKCAEGAYQDFERLRALSQKAHPPVEISGVFTQASGYFRTTLPQPPKAILGSRDGKAVAGLAFIFDPQDRFIRLIDAFSEDELSIGALVLHATQMAQEQFAAIYVEMDVLLTAPRLLKAAEQIGFVPIAYLPAIYSRGGSCADVVKMVKLNTVYSDENSSFTSHARVIGEIVNHNFQDQKMGVAIINLLRTLPFFEGLGDGELRKIARLFTQKLYRPGEKLFNKGDSGNEAYVVMRGQVDILLEEGVKPIASMVNGQILGELAFLDGAVRGAIAQAA